MVNQHESPFYEADATACMRAHKRIVESFPYSLPGTLKSCIHNIIKSRTHRISTLPLLKKEKPKAVLNLALPYQDLTIMDACLACGVDYIDTANYERYS